nr:hypothetical protein [Tanacetum cinerariifolium]
MTLSLNLKTKVKSRIEDGIFVVSVVGSGEGVDCRGGEVKNLDKDFFSSYDVYSLKRSLDDKDKDEDPSAGSDRGLQKRKTSKDAEPTTSPKNKDSSSRSSKGTNSQPKSFENSVHAEELGFEVGDTDTPQGGDYPFDLFEPLSLIMHRNPQSVPVEFFINNDLKYLQGGILTMTYTTSTTKTKAAQYDLLGIKDMTFYAYARGIQSRGDVYSTKRILAVTHVSVMSKHGYGYLEKIVVRSADNALYKFKEGDDVADFTIALRMFTMSLVIQKRVEDFQLGVENITKNVDIEYLPKRRWSTLEKKRAHYMIKYINKLLKERRMMRSLEKFIGGRLYGTDLGLLQRTI